MKHEFALMAGSFLLCLATSVSAQSGSPPDWDPANPFPIYSVPSLTKGGRSSPRWKLRTVNEAILQSYCEKVVADKRRIFYLNSRQFKMSVQVKGIYTREDMLFFRLFFFNHSHLDYDVDSIRFIITDTRRPKNGREKVTTLSPAYAYGNVRHIRGKSREDAVMVLPRFTLPLNKSLIIEVLEKNGGRHLQVRADNYTLVKARPIPNPLSPEGGALKGE